MRPQVFTVDPSYNPDAPFINQRYGQSYLTHTSVALWRFNETIVPLVLACGPRIAGLRTAGSIIFGAPGGVALGVLAGVISLERFLSMLGYKHVNISANIGYHSTPTLRWRLTASRATLLNRPNELILKAAADFPVNQYFQLIAEINSVRYMQGRTTNAFENNPWDLIGGFRIFPARWWGFGFAYRRHMNQARRREMEDTTSRHAATVVCQPTTIPCPPLFCR
jgi:hypothetical protein